MVVKEYEILKPVVIFYQLAEQICFDYKHHLFVANSYNLDQLKKELETPCKIIFKRIPVNIVVDILENLRNEYNSLFVYREQNLQTNTVSYNAILNEKEKVKKIDN